MVLMLMAVTHHSEMQSEYIFSFEDSKEKKHIVTQSCHDPGDICTRQNPVVILLSSCYWWEWQSSEITFSHYYFQTLSGNGLLTLINFQTKLSAKETADRE